jgi:Zn-dependent M28 family amino/carboxypeptidase
MLPVLIHGYRGKLPAPSAALTSLAAELRRDVIVLSEDIGPRHTGTPDRLHLAAQFLASVLKNTGFDLRTLAYEAHGVTCVNLEATPPGQDSRAPAVILGAHYDSIPHCPAANDNASGVAGVLAVARRWLADPPGSPRLGIRFVLFANEEPPHFRTDTMGSLVYARHCRESNDDLRGMICLETIGCYQHHPGSQRWPTEVPGLVRRLLPEVGDFILWAGDWASRGFVRRCGEMHRDSVQFPLLAVAVPDAMGEIGWSDHWSFNQAGYPSVMVTDTAPYRYKWYHRVEDTVDKIDFESMARVVEGVDVVLRRLVHAG